MRGSSLAERSQSGPRDHDGDLPAIGGGAPIGASPSTSPAAAATRTRCCPPGQEVL